MNPIDLANTYVDKYLYGKNVNFDEMYNEIIKPFSELSDKTSFLSYTSGRVNKHIEFLNDHIEELKKEIKKKKKKKKKKNKKKKKKILFFLQKIFKKKGFFIVNKDKQLEKVLTW